MGAPRLEPSREEKRKQVLKTFDWDRLQEAECLERIAEAASLIADVPSSHVSLMKTETQCVISGVGMKRHEFVRDHTFCAHTLVKKETLIIEDATEDERFEDNPYVQQEDGIRFYAGLPIIVDDVPVGTLCAIDYEPRTLHLADRAELFGLLHATESYLNMLYEHGSESETYEFASHMTEARASMTLTRHGEKLERASVQRLVQSERRLEECLEAWVPEAGASQAEHDALEEIDDPVEGIGYEETQPEEE
ncbi:MAG: GAF domain-containing protein [Bradymonadaceae bacterium]